IDSFIFPLEYAAGIYELSETKFARISPKDVRIGFAKSSKYSAHSRVAGDEFFHFAAFFRKEWRSNDILWSRLDCISKVIETLLHFDQEQLDHFRERLKSPATGAFSSGQIQSCLPQCPQNDAQALVLAWQNLINSTDLKKDLDV